MNKELTEKLFHRAHNVSLDLAAINIQRGRDHGIPGYPIYKKIIKILFSYIEFRKFCNLTAPETWEDLAVDTQSDLVVKKLKMLYGHPGIFYRKN